MNNLNIFLSSTCYDLSQIRADLSEFENFPINPQKNTIENCINIVKENADVLLLIVGNRYGSTIENGKSITNAEFSTAHQKGIPIFVFIDTKTLNTFYVWKENKNGNFSKFVDSVKIFEFIESLRESSQMWTFEFEKAQDIISILKFQLSYLFKESLKIKIKYEGRVSEYFTLNLSTEALKILIDKPDTFEIEFFSQTLKDEIRKKEILNNDYKYKIQYDPKSFIHDINDIPNWAMSRIATIENLIFSLSNLINEAFPEFYRAPGKPSDLYGLYYIARTYAKLYDRLINWSIDIQSAHVPQTCIELRDKLARLAKKVINECWEYPFETEKKINDSKIAISNSNQTLRVELILKISFSKEDLQAYNNVFEKFKDNYLQ